MDSTTSTATAQLSEMLVQAVGDYAIYMVDLNGRIASWNTGAHQIKGYSASEAINQPLSLFYTPEDRSLGKPQKLLDTVRSEGRAYDEGWRLRKDGTRFWAQVVVEVVRDANGELIGFAKITRDMTQSHEAAQHIETMRAQLFQAQKLEALGQLTGGMAHDFNNLLTIIIGAARLAARTKDPQRLAELLENIQQAGLRGSRLTQHLLTFARRKSLQSEVVNLHEVLQAAQSLLAQALPKAMTLKLVIEDDLKAVEVELDASQLEMTLLNLVFNARDALNGSGEIGLHACVRHMQGEWDNLHGEFVLITVSDDGMGIAPDVLTRIFEPFFTTKDFGQGTGLGLSQVYGFIKNLKGSIKVDSELGRGTRITLYVPVIGDKAT
ncbi:two-component system sensor histidine kinase NtrB [Pseudomonas borbori]